MIYCSVCHGATGDGRGMIVQRGFVPPPSFLGPSGGLLDNRERYLQTAPPGHVFNVITNGWGAMYSYADRIEPADRWAIAAYIRVLQLSQNTDPALLSADDQAALQEKSQ